MPKVTTKKVATKKKKSVAKKTITNTKKLAKKKIKTDKPKVAKRKNDYLYSVGRRKSSTARIRYYLKGKGEIIINGKNYKDFFNYFELQNIVEKPLKIIDKLGKGKLTIKVKGGGKKGQAESIQLGISRVLLKNDKNLRKILRVNNLLTRDPRVKERKKAGLKKARRAPQWQKR